MHSKKQRLFGSIRMDALLCIRSQLSSGMNEVANLISSCITISQQNTTGKMSLEKGNDKYGEIFSKYIRRFLRERERQKQTNSLTQNMM